MKKILLIFSIMSLLTACSSTDSTVIHYGVVQSTNTDLSTFKNILTKDSDGELINVTNDPVSSGIRNGILWSGDTVAYRIYTYNEPQFLIPSQFTYKLISIIPKE